MLSPSLRNIPFSGIEWSYQMRDLGFNDKGEKALRDDEEESSRSSANNNTSSSSGNNTKVSDSTLDALEDEIQI
jgi:hypothetical protein